MILAVAVHIVDATGLWRDCRDVDAQGEVDIWGTVDGWAITVTVHMILLRPGAISLRAAL